MAVNEKLVFKPAVQALFVHSLGARLTPAFRAKLVALGIDVDRLLPGYAYEVWEAALIAAAVEFFPGMSRDDALTELGKQLTVASIDASPVGKHLLPLLKVMGTGRALRRALSRSTEVNFNTVTFGAETPTSLAIEMSFVGNIPSFALGGVQALGDALGTTLTVRVKQYRAPSVTYLVEWK